MKTLKYLSSLSLALIFIAITAGFSKKSENQNPLFLRIPMVRYQVNIHFSSDKPFCNTYWVQIRDENGNLIAPAQIFMPGKSQYIFNVNSFEKGDKERGTTRIATLTTSPRLINLECLNDLITRPTVKRGLFFPGQTYSFDLFPIWETHQSKD